MYPLGPKSAPLVSRMLSDLLMITTSNKELSVKTTTLMSERDILAAEISPLRSENRRLVRENNQLHLEIIRQAEDFDRRERGLQQMMKKNEGDMKDATFISNQNNQLVEKYENEINSLMNDKMGKLDKLMSMLENKKIDGDVASTVGNVREILKSSIKEQVSEAATEVVNDTIDKSTVKTDLN